MGFMQGLTPSSPGIFGMPQPSTPNDELYLYNKLRDREMQDFKDKANFMSDLSFKNTQRDDMYNYPIRQGMRQLYDPNAMAGSEGSNNPRGMRDTKGLAVLNDPNQMTGYQKGELDIRNKELSQQKDMESQKLAQQKTQGQEALDIKDRQEKLNQEKSDQIHQQKVDELTTKQNEYKQKMDLAYQQLSSKNASLEQQLELHKSIAENTKLYHDAELAMKDLEFKKTSDLHQQQIDALNEKLKQGQNTQTTTEIDSSGNKKTVTTKRGDAARRIQVRGPNGETGTVTADEELPPGWTKVGGGDQEQ